MHLVSEITILGILVYMAIHAMGYSRNYHYQLQIVIVEVHVSHWTEASQVPIFFKFGTQSLNGLPQGLMTNVGGVVFCIP